MCSFVCLFAQSSIYSSVWMFIHSRRNQLARAFEGLNVCLLLLLFDPSSATLFILVIILCQSSVVTGMNFAVLTHPKVVSSHVIEVCQWFGNSRYHAPKDISHRHACIMACVYRDSIVQAPASCSHLNSSNANFREMLIPLELPLALDVIFFLHHMWKGTVCNIL